MIVALALKNLRRSARVYATFFLSITANVVVYYLFVSVKGNATFANLIDSRSGFVAAFDVASVLIAVMSAVFLSYSVTFLQRKRGREFGLYKLFGLSRTKIGLLIAVENLALALLALVAGLLVGTLFQRLFFMALLSLLDLRVDLGFLFDGQACLQTAAVFMGLMALASVASFVVLFRVQAMGLFRSAVASERPVKRNPLLALAFLVLLVAGYAIALDSKQENLVFNFLLISSWTIVATLGFLAFFVPWMVETLRRNARFAWKNGRLLALGHLAHRIRKNVFSLFAIAISSTVALCAIGAVLNYRINEGDQVTRAMPASMSYQHSDSGLDKKIDDVLAAKWPGRVESAWTIDSIDMTMTSASSSHALNVAVTSWSAYRAAAAQRIRLDMDGPAEGHAYLCQGMTISEFVGLSAMLVAVNYENSSEEVDYTVGTLAPIPWSPSNRAYGSTFLVVPDALFGQIRAAHQSALTRDRSLVLSDEYHIQGLEADMLAVAGTRALLCSKMDVTGPIVSVLNLILFIGTFVCLVFLGSAGSVLHFKLLMDAQEDRSRYKVASALGFGRRELSAIARAEVLPFYAVPMLLFAAHGAVALTTMSRVLRFELALPNVASIGGFLAAYACFAFLSLRVYRDEIGIRASAGARRG